MEFIGQKVMHKTLGQGEITWFGGKEQNDNKYIKVQFATKSIELSYPTAFEKYLTALDPEFEHVIKLELKKIDEERQAKRKETKIEPTVKKSTNVVYSTKQPKKFTLLGNNKALQMGKSLGTNSKTAYLECCELFGWDKSEAKNFGHQGALLYAKRATPEGYSPWFITHHNLTGTKGGEWKNTIVDDRILEEWDNYDERMWEDKTNRVVFLKLSGNYHFFGVYYVDKIELKANGKYTKTYKRISKEYSNALEIQPS